MAATRARMTPDGDQVRDSVQMRHMTRLGLLAARLLLVSVVLACQDVSETPEGFLRNSGQAQGMCSLGRSRKKCLGAWKGGLRT